MTRLKYSMKLSWLACHAIACTVQYPQLQYSNEEVFQLSHKKNHLEAHTYLSLLAELPVDSCTSSAPLIRKLVDLLP